MVEEGPQHIERGIRQEQLTITAESLYKDNHSPKAIRRRERYDQDEEAESQVTVFRCSDSRYILTYRHSNPISTIATGGPKDLFDGLINKQTSPGIVMLPHENCGGLGAKSALEEFGLPDDPDETEWYLRTHVPDHDPVVVAAKSAANVSRIDRDKPVLAAVHKHDTGDIIPLATYRDGKPAFSTQVPEAFSEFFRAQQRYIGHLKSEFPNLSEIQQVQNPGLLAIVRDVRPLEVMLPETTRRPGSAFRIMSSRPKDRTLGVDPDDAKLVVAQAKYPIENFSALNTILVATEYGASALELINLLLRRPWARAWAAKPTSRIYAAVMNHGVLEAIDEFRPE